MTDIFLRPGEASATSVRLRNTTIPDGGTQYALTVDAGSFAEAGAVVGLAYGRAVGAAAASFSESGASVAPRAARTISAASAAFAVSAIAEGLREAHTMAPASGSFALSGTSAGLSVATRLSAAAGSLAWTGTAATLSSSAGGRTLTATSRALRLRGYVTRMSYGRVRGGRQQVLYDGQRWWQRVGNRP